MSHGAVIHELDVLPGNEFAGSHYPGPGFYYNPRTMMLMIVVGAGYGSPVLTVFGGPSLTRQQLISMVQGSGSTPVVQVKTSDPMFRFEEVVKLIAISREPALVRDYYPPEQA